MISTNLTYVLVVPYYAWLHFHDRYCWPRLKQTLVHLAKTASHDELPMATTWLGGIRVTMRNAQLGLKNERAIQPENGMRVAKMPLTEIHLRPIHS